MRSSLKMSRLGKKPIIIPDKVELNIKDDVLFFKGPLGESELKLFPDFEIIQEDKFLRVKPKIINKKTRMLWGTLWSLINNRLIGVSSGFTKTLILEGLGYNVEITPEKELVFKLGYSHPVKIKIPDNIKVEIKPLKGQFHIIISGNDKEKVGQFASFVRKIKPRNIYKLKGFRYLDEKVKVKPVKKAVGK